MPPTMQQEYHIPSLPPKPKVESKNLSKDSDMLLNEAMNRLSLKEREQVYEDVHGVSDLIDESTSFVNDKLHQMEKEICDYCNNDNSYNNNSGNTNSVSYAYQLALSKSPKYCTDKRFRILFLRSVSFDSKAAAVRFVKFFQLKHDLFGVEKLVKPHICLSDLDPTDIEALQDGSFQILPQRDSAGRSIGFSVPFFHRNHSVKSHARALFYIGMRIVMDEETQKRGIVGIIWRTGKMATTVMEASWYNAKTVEVLPVRWVSFHLCLSFDPVIQAAMKTALAIQKITFRDNIRTRLRAHMGTETECLYKLMSYGIPTKAIPFSKGGTDNGSKRLREFYKCQNLFETKYLENDETFDFCGGSSSRGDSIVPVVIVPGNNDILTMGRKTKTIQSFPGNVKFRDIIERCMDEYDRLNRNGRTEFSKMIVSMIKQSGSKYLKHNEVGWVVMSDDEAKDKVTHAFRNLRQTKKSASTTTSGGHNNINQNKKTMIAVSGVENSIFKQDGLNAQHYTHKTNGQPTEPIPLESSSSILSQTIGDISEFEGNCSCLSGFKRRKLSI